MIIGPHGGAKFIVFAGLGRNTSYNFSYIRYIFQSEGHFYIFNYDISLQAKLQKVKLPACLRIAGAVPTFPTAALEILLTLPPLYMYVMREPGVSAFKTHQTVFIKPGNRFRHRRIRDFITLDFMS